MGENGGERRRESIGGENVSERFWIQEAIGKEGSYRASVARRYGKSAFDPEGKIKMSIIRKDIKTKKGKVHKQAVLARTLRRF